jgi:pyruvate formate lyase activating enzyme
MSGDPHRSQAQLDTPLHFSAFHPDWRMHDVPRTSAATLQMARDIAQQCGLRYVYIGNVHDEAGQSTYCHNCGQRLIGRDWYNITSWAMSADGAARIVGRGAMAFLRRGPETGERVVCRRESRPPKGGF